MSGAYNRLCRAGSFLVASRACFPQILKGIIPKRRAEMRPTGTATTGLGHNSHCSPFSSPIPTCVPPLPPHLYKCGGSGQKPIQTTVYPETAEAKCVRPKTSPTFHTPAFAPALRTSLLPLPCDVRFGQLVAAGGSDDFKAVNDLWPSFGIFFAKCANNSLCTLHLL